MSRHTRPPVRSAEWWACDEPERPYDAEVAYHAGCKWCMAKAKADLMAMGDILGVGGSSHSARVETLGTWLAEQERLLEEATR